MAGWLVALVCLTGCDQTWGLVHVHSPADASVATECPASYDITIVGFASKYRYESGNAQWAPAEASCADDAIGITHLVVLGDDNERQGLHVALTARQITDTVWIGLSDRKVEDAFLWVTDQDVGMPPQTTPPWRQMQPDDAQGGQDCVRMEGVTSIGVDGLLDDSECTAAFDYVCECDFFREVPSNF